MKKEPKDLEARRRKILDAATRLYALHGAESVTYGDIARAAGVSRTLVYFYFPEPAALFLSAVLDSSEKVHSRFVDAVKGKTTGLKQIEAIGRAYVKFQEECPDSFALFAANEARPHGKPSALLDRICFHGQATTNIVEETIRTGLRDGSIRPKIPRPEIHAFLLWAFTHGLAQFVAMRKETLKGERLDPSKVIEEGFRFLREGMAAR